MIEPQLAQPILSIAGEWIVSGDAQWGQLKACARTFGAPEPPPSPGASRRLLSLSSEKTAG